MESKHYLYVDNPFSKYAYKGNHLTKSVVEVDSCRARKVLSRYSQKVEECKVEHPERVVSPYFQKVKERKVEHPQRAVSPYFPKVEECKVEHPQRVVSPYFLKVEECKVDHPQRVVSPYFPKVEDGKVEHPQRAVSPYFQNCSTKSIEDLNRFRYQSEKVSSLRECVKKSEHEGTVEEDSSPLPLKISKDSRKRSKVEKPRKSKRKTKPFLKADRCREAYKRKTLDNNWVPPPSGFEVPLLQEYHFHDPWRVIVICMLLNRTQGKQVHSSKYFFSFSLLHPLYFMLMFFCSS